MYRPPSPGMNVHHQPRFRAQFERRPNFAPRGRGPPHGQPFNRWRPSATTHNYQDEHWCETCDRGFATIEMLENHKQQHQKCNIDGCQFIAHPKVITKHIQMQHSTGLFSKMGNLKNPEDLAKWREERKKKFPTKENVARKNAEIKEKIERGEKMGLKFIKDKNKKPQGEGQKRKYPFENKKNEAKRYTNVNKRKFTPKKENNVPPVLDRRTLKPFAGILYMIMDTVTEDDNKLTEESCSYKIDDDDNYLQDTTKHTNNPQIHKPSVCGALSSLMCEYATSDDEEKETFIEKKIQLEENYITRKHKLEESYSHLKKPKSKYDDGKKDMKQESDDSGPEEVKTDKLVENKTEIVDQVPCDKDMRERKAIGIKNNVYKRKPNIKKSRLPSTLLQKLLHGEIKQERNTILQCIRHIVKHNYFDK